MFNSRSSLRKLTLIFIVALIALSSVSYALAGGKKEPANSHASLTDISFPASDPTAAGWAVGQNGRDAVILKQDTSGVWNEIKTFKGKTLNSIVMLTPTEGYAVGNGGYVLAYDGRDWRSQDTHSHANLRRVKTGPDGMVFAVGDTGTAVVKLLGFSWFALPSAGNFTAYGGFAISDGGLGYDGYLVGAGGNIRKWTNATFSWSTIASGTTDDLSDLNMSSSTLGYISSANGKVWDFDGTALTYLTQLTISGKGVLDLRSGSRAKSANGPKAGSPSPLDLIGADAIVVGNDPLGAGSVGILSGGRWGITSLINDKQLNYLTKDSTNNVWTVGTDATIIVVQ